MILVAARGQYSDTIRVDRRDKNAGAGPEVLPPAPKIHIAVSGDAASRGRAGLPRVADPLIAGGSRSPS